MTTEIKKGKRWCSISNGVSWLIPGLLLLTLAGCGSAQTNFQSQFANACYTLQTENKSITTSATGTRYALHENHDLAIPFYLKPSGLDRFLLFDPEEYLLAAHNTVTRTQEMDMRLEWRFNYGQNQTFTLQSTQTNQWLAHEADHLILTEDATLATPFSTTRSDQCSDFPEASTNAFGEPAAGEFEDGAVWGVADVHNHLFGTLAFGGNVMSGEVFHPLGITEALRNCSDEHGKQGKVDIIGYTTSSIEGYGNEAARLAELPFKLLFNQPLHDTAGYPDFTEWPNSSNTTHQMGYYKWLERAYLGGLRLLVNFTVESGPLCKINRELGKHYAPTDPEFRYDPGTVCNGTETTEKQLQATLNLVDYIDAQHGGPGKGWLRLVETPEEARAVIREKKLAMIMGSETPDLFSCINGVEGGRAQCTEDYIEQKLDEYVAKGIRSVFPVHHYDNDFGGAYVFNPIIEAARVVQDGALFHYESCDAYDYQPILAIQIPEMYYLLFPRAMKELPLFPFVPEADGYCNRRGLTDPGAHLIREMMKRGMLIETAHMSVNMKEAVIEMAEHYDYPLIDSHMEKAFDESTKAVEARYLSLGGVRAPLLNRRITVNEYGGVSKTCRSHTSQDIAIQLMAYSDTREALGLDRGVVFGTDLHGMVQQSKPRFGEEAQCDEIQHMPVVYPFTSFDGSVVFDKQITGNRAFDFNTQGLAHIGMLPDLIQDMRNQGMTDDYMEAYFRGAESYLQTWEKARERSKQIRHQ